MLTIDEADVTVLESQLSQANRLAGDLAARLTLFHLRFSGHETSLKPVMRQTERLMAQRAEVAEGLELIAKVETYARELAAMEDQLAQPLFSVDLTRYMGLLEEGRTALATAQLDLQGFSGVTSHFETALQDGEATLQGAFRKTVLQMAGVYEAGSEEPPVVRPGLFQDLQALLHHGFGTLDEVVVARSRALDESMKPAIRKMAQGHGGLAAGAEALVAALTAEHAFWSTLLPEAASPYFARVAEKVVERWCAEVERAVQAERQLREGGAYVFEVLGSVAQVRDTLQRVLGTDRLVRPLEKLTQNLDGASVFVSILRDAANSVATATDIRVQGGIVGAVTTQMTMLGRLARHRALMESVISSFLLGDWIPVPKPAWVGRYSSVLQQVEVDELDPAQLLSCYYSDVVDAIMVTLEMRCMETLEKRAAMGFVLVTNLSVVENMLRKTDTGAILGGMGYGRISKLKKRFLNYFLDGWKQAAASLMDVTVVAGGDTHKMSSKEKDAIKEKFRSFNSQVEELAREHQGFRITDKELRGQLQKEINFISPLYRRFYDKYGEADWVRKAKVVRWGKLEFDQLLGSL